MRLVSRVTAPLRAKARPSRTAPVCIAIDVSAMMLPTKSVRTPIVAELATCQNTLHGAEPLMNDTLLSTAVTSVESIWKMNTADGSFWALRVNVPVTWASATR